MQRSHRRWHLRLRKSRVTMSRCRRRRCLHWKREYHHLQDCPPIGCYPSLLCRSHLLVNLANWHRKGQTNICFDVTQLISASLAGERTNNFFFQHYCYELPECPQRGPAPPVGRSILVYVLVAVLYL